MLGLLKNFVVWGFFMLFKGNGHEDLSYTKTLGMVLLASGTVYYVHLDLKLEPVKEEFAIAIDSPESKGSSRRESSSDTETDLIVKKKESS